MHNFNPEVYKKRRQQLFERMSDNSVAIFIANPELIRSNDTHYKYRASSDIVYLTGFEEPEAVLVLAPGHEDGDFFLFVRKRDPLREQWDGRRYGPAGAMEVFNADLAFDVADIDGVLPNLIAGRDRLYYTLGSNHGFDAKVTKLLNSLRYQRYSASTAPPNLSDARDLVHRQRMVKSPEEIQVMRKAAKISAKAHHLAMAHAKPGVWEYQLQAVIEHHFRVSGASGAAYESIVGTGDNATILHYIENESQLKDGEVVLIDAGCEYDYYAADISRSFPVNGKFTPAQRDCYDAVLECEEECMARVVKGMAYNDIKRFATRKLTEGLVSLGVLKGSIDELVETRKYARYYPHSIGHFLGSDVHDVGSYFNDDGSDLILQPGMVVTIEPGLYFREEDETVPKELRGVGIRIEDDVAVGQEKPDILTRDCIRGRSEVEDMVGSAYE